MGFSILKRTVGTSQLFTLLGILERTRGWWSLLGKLMNSITLLSKNIFHIIVVYVYDLQVVVYIS